MPNVSAGNHSTDQTVANNVIVPLARDGSICVYSWAATHLILDVTVIYR